MTHPPVGEKGLSRLARLKSWIAEETGGAPDGTRRTFRQRFLHMIGRDDPPEVVAASFALGVAIAFTPFFGLHLAMALTLAFLLRLKKLDVVLGTLVVNPLTIGPVSAAAIPLGRVLLTARSQAIHALPWNEVFTRSFWQEAGPAAKAIFLQWFVGMFALTFLSGALVYVILVRAIRAHRAREARKRETEDAPEARLTPGS